MAEPSSQKTPRSNPFWAYRDPLTGRWMTLMTSAQCQQLAAQAFAPKVRHQEGTTRGDRITNHSDISAG